MRSTLFIIFLLFSSFTFAQTLTLKNDIPFIENGDTLSSPFAGGFNQPQFSQVELNEDGLMDLVVFDRSGYKILPFVNHGGAGQIDYRYAPEYESAFPEITHWMLMRDYNCDGKMDIFCYGQGVSSIAVYRNDSDMNGLRFNLEQGMLMDDLEGEQIAVLSRDLPGIADIDGDGDLDILAFDFGGLYVEWFQNQSVENGHGCDSLQFDKVETCWGAFQENGLDNTVTLGVSCKGFSGRGAVHSGSTISIFDYEGDGAMEIVLGDIGAGNLVYLHNGGTPTDAQIDTFSYSFPNSSPVSLEIFPAAYFLDIDLDGKEEMIVAPNAPNVSANFQNVWLYENIGIGDTNEFDFRTKTFLADEMVECGMSSHPVFFDYNGDGLQDIVIGNNHYKSLSTNEKSALTIYRNVGDAMHPAFVLDSRDYLKLSGQINPPEINMSPTFGDMDADGDFDLILGSSTGKMHYFQNNPMGDSAVFTLLNFNMFGLDVGQGATPEIFDLDGDGLLDLIVGEQTGNFNFFKNRGTAQAMDFNMPPDDNSLGGININGGFIGNSVGRMVRNGIQKPEFFISGEPGHISRYDDIENRIFNTYFLRDSAYGGVDEGARASLDLADIDGDGRYEFVIGNLRGGIGIYDASVKTSLEPAVIAQHPFDFEVSVREEMLEIRFGEMPFREANLAVMDLQGRLLVRKKLDGFQAEVYIPQQFATGFYLVEVIFEGEYSLVRKVLLY